MHKEADIDLFWTRSVDIDIVKVDTLVSIDGGPETRTTVESPDIQSIRIRVKANSSGSLKVVSYDRDGLVATSEEYDFVIGDLVAPQPATDLGHRIVQVFDVPDEGDEPTV